MAAEWYYRTSTGEEEGPVTAARLKQLAQRGEIGPDIQVKKGDEGRWIPASRVKGLFESEPLKLKSIKTPASPDAGRRTSALPVIDDEFTLAKKQRVPPLVLGVGVCGTLLVIVLIALASGIFRKGDTQKLDQQQRVTLNSGEKQKVDPSNLQNEPPAAVGAALSPSLSSPEVTVRGYLSASTWQERLPYVLNADRVRPQMAKLYEKVSSFKTENFLPGTVTGVENRDTPIGGGCTVTVDVSTSHPDSPQWRYRLVRTPEGFKVDWEMTQELGKKERLEAFDAKVRKLNLVIDVEILRCRQSGGYTEIDLQITNRATALLSYVAVTMGIESVSNQYLGNDFTNETNVRSGQSIVKSVTFNNVKVAEVASWKIGIKKAVIDEGNGQRIDATEEFKLNERFPGTEKGYRTRLESCLSGHWRGMHSQFYFPSTKSEAVFLHSDGLRVLFSYSVIERNYSAGTFQLRFVSDTGGGLVRTFSINDQKTLTTYPTHFAEENGVWQEFKDEVKDKLTETWNYVDERDSP